ncbi:hypothetical protein EYC98_14380 [Halieaceae bacterium IMCC14734]|uniref:Redoxin domain-containing protein n=1 Tax=Candidatus Litorirhabdus singularis TaxID=2518993 RepID=A0ABT3TI88_9GAMM|nr:hypothetical protein [Candidatus Litorirhabdus singularis]MCX2982046.1 hypothetical protein [Candidatus Litorirhabdus singularis]
MQDNEFNEYTDEFGQTAPLPASHGQRKPPPVDFQFGPAEGERFPDCTLRDADGVRINLHEDRGSAKAAVLFFRSAVW